MNNKWQYKTCTKIPANKPCEAKRNYLKEEKKIDYRKKRRKKGRLKQ